MKPKRKINRLTEYDYAQIWQYIDTNPQLWHKDCFYEEPPHEP